MHYLRHKIRGQKRKVNDLKKQLERLGDFFPDESFVHDSYYHYHFPCSQGLLDSKNSSSKIRKTAMQLLIDSAVRLRKARPDNLADKKIVVSINLPYLWDSQVIVFYNKEYYQSFFDRDSSEQKWIEIKESTSIIDKYKLRIPGDFKVKGYLEEINDIDYQYSGQIWFIGEL